MTALQPCANPQCRQPTAHDTDGTDLPAARLLCLHHLAAALNLPPANIPKPTYRLRCWANAMTCPQPPTHLFTYGRYCSNHAPKKPSGTDMTKPPAVYKKPLNPRYLDKTRRRRTVVDADE